MQEYEMKFLISKADFYRLLKQTFSTYKTAKKSFKNQINFYYDTNSLDLYNQNITLRVRQKDDLLLLQEKCHTGSSVLVSNEEENVIGSLPITMLYKNKKVHLQGQLYTQRFSIQLSDGVKIEFDKNNYLAIEDYEIEIEFSKDCELEAKQLAKSFALENLNGLGKSTRFFNIYKELLHGKS